MISGMACETIRRIESALRTIPKIAMRRARGNGAPAFTRHLAADALPLGPGQHAGAGDEDQRR